MSQHRSLATRSSPRAWRAAVGAAAVAVVASFAAAPVANAAAGSSPAGVTHHRSERQVTHLKAAGAQHHLNLHLKKPAKVVARPVRLWHGTASYVLRPNHRTAPDVVSGITGPCQITAGNHSGTWSPASCPSGYEVQADITVPLGKTLTIKPNTIVYFDTTPEGSLGTLDPSELPDLVVDGTLTVAGTATEPVLFTSANAAPRSATTPAAGDWGYVFFDHTAANKGTGSLTHLRLLYGEGIATDRSAPPITDSRISNVAAGLTSPTIATSITKGAAIDYEDVPGGTVALNDDVFDFGGIAGVAIESNYSHTGFSGATYPGSPFTLAMVDSHVTAGASSGFGDAVLAESEIMASTTATNHSAVTLNVHGTRVTETGNGNALQVDAGSESTTVPGTALVTGAFRDNSFDGGEDSSGLNISTDVEDSTAAGLVSCSRAAACVSLPFLHDAVSGDDSAVDVSAEVEHGAGSSLISVPVGKVETTKVKKRVKCKTKTRKHRVCTRRVKKLVDVSGGDFESADEQAWELDVDSEGPGAATLRAPLVATTFSSREESLEAEINSDQGVATSAVTARHLTMTALNDGNIDLDTAGSDSAAPLSSDGSAHNSVKVVGGTYIAEDQNVDVDDTFSGYGPASSTVTVTDADLSSDDTNVDLETKASDVAGSGAATSSATISGSKLVADGSGVDSETTASYGTAPATGKVTVTHTTIEAEGGSVGNVANSSDEPGSHGNATVDTVLSHDTLQSNDEDVDLEAESHYGGAATSDPTILDSTLISGDEAVDNSAESANNDGQGSAKAHPTITGSTITADGDALDNDANGERGTSSADASFTITGSRLTAFDDAAIEADAEAKGSGVSTVDPDIKTATILANEDEGLELQTGDAGTGPMVVGGSVTASTIRSSDDAVQVDAGSGGVGSSSTFDTVFKDDAVVSDNAAFEADYDVDGASLQIAPTITGGSISAVDDDAVDFDAEGYGGAASDVLSVAPVISHEAIRSEDGISLHSQDTHGSATPGSTYVGGSVTSSTVVATDNGGVAADAECLYCLGGARAHVAVTNTAIRAGGNAVDVEADTSTNTTASASISGSVTSTHDDLLTAGDGAAINLDASSAKGNAVDGFSVSGVRLSGVGGGIANTSAASAGDASYTGSITGVTVGTSKSASSSTGINSEVDAGNNATDSGTIGHNTVSDLDDAAGIFDVVSAGDTSTVTRQILNNSVSNVGTYGIIVQVLEATAPPVSKELTISHNSVSRTGFTGIEVYGVRAAVAANKITYNGLNASAAASTEDGLYADAEPYQGGVTCNAIWGDAVGIQYGTANPTAGSGGHNGDPETNDNTLRDPASSRRNSLDLRTGNTGTNPTDAQSNYWGGVPRLWAPTNRYDVTPDLKKAPACAAKAGA